MRVVRFTHFLSTANTTLSTTYADNFKGLSGTFTPSPQISAAVTTTTIFIYKYSSHTRTHSFFGLYVQQNPHFALGAIYAKLSNLEEKMRRGLRREIYC